jgi:hypothetical protein
VPILSMNSVALYSILSE